VVKLRALLYGTFVPKVPSVPIYIKVGPLVVKVAFKVLDVGGVALNVPPVVHK